MPKLSLRDLFALVTIAAILTAWYVDHRRQAMTQAELRQKNSELEKRHFVYFSDDLSRWP
jgi:hypothetical protein